MRVDGCKDEAHPSMAPLTKRQKVAKARWAAGGFLLAAEDSDGSGSDPEYLPSNVKPAEPEPEDEPELNAYLVSDSDVESLNFDPDVEEVGFEGDQELLEDAQMQIQRQTDEMDKKITASQQASTFQILMDQSKINAVNPPRKEAKIGKGPYRGDSRWTQRRNALKKQAKAATVQDCKPLTMIFKPLKKSEPESEPELEPEREVLDVDTFFDQAERLISAPVEVNEHAYEVKQIN